MDIVHIVDIKTTPDRLFEALTSQSGLRGWWTTGASAEPKVGAVNEFPFPGHAFKLRVDALEPASRVAWTSLQAPPDWTGTRVEFRIQPTAEGSILRFAHAGFASTEGGFGLYNFAWAQFLRSLKLLCETGKGEPAGPG